VRGQLQRNTRGRILLKRSGMSMRTTAFKRQQMEVDNPGCEKGNQIGGKQAPVARYLKQSGGREEDHRRGKKNVRERDLRGRRPRGSKPKRKDLEGGDDAPQRLGPRSRRNIGWREFEC